MADPNLHDFWEASALNDLTVPQFGARVQAYEVDAEEFRPDALGTSAGAHQLAFKADRLHKTMARRRSSRDFSNRSMSEKELGQVLSAVSGSATQRLYPSAGGLATVEIYALLHRVESPLGRIAARYLSADHSLAPVTRELPDDAALDELLSLEGHTPAVTLLFAVKLEETVRKYGPRGGRFALIEVGHACQNIALRLTAEKLVGYQLGGTLDHNLEQLLQLGPGRAQVTLGYAIGHPG